MGKLGNVSFKDVLRVFESQGWVVDRQRGSHIIFVKDGERYHLSVPNQKELGPGLLRKLIRDAGMTVDQFLALL